MLAQFQTQLRFSDEIIQAAIKTGCLRKAFFFCIVSTQEKTVLLLKKEAFPT